MVDILVCNVDEDIAQRLKEAPHHFARLVPAIELARRATEKAIEYRHSIYDCFYLALAEREGGF
jgi:predicted nucleic acid-binding protein